MAATFLKYGAECPVGVSDLEIELAAIARGGKWITPRGTEAGLGMFEHMMNARKLLWPERYRHDWTDLLYQNFIANDLTIMLGSGSSQKTSHASEYVLLRYFSAPDDTLAVVSTTKVEKLETGIFGEIKMLWSRARERFDWIPGNLVDYKHCIATDNLKEGDVRDLRKGIMGKACYVGSKWVGLGEMAGTKQTNIIYVADELQFMAETFIASWPNLFTNGNVKILGSGNPKHDPDDELGKAAEPKEGWSSIGEPEKATSWPTRFMGGVCVNLVGTDSPNFHAAARGEPEPYPKLIGPKFAARIAHDWGTDSPEYYTQVKGVMRIDMAVKRVITRQLCREHGAFEKVVWSGRPTTKVMGVDPSYGGGDACVIYVLEFGEDNAGMEVLSVVRMIKVKLDLKKTISVEDQIANEVWDYGQLLKIPPANIGFDPFGKGTLGNAFARKFGSLNAIQPVDSGARPTDRPVRRDLYVDEANGEKRLKTCKEHYSKFVTEAWFSVRYVIEANQFRGMIESTMIEGCGRKYDMVAGNKIEIESKDDLKERVGKSPNEFDALAIAVEMARRSGFAIGLLGPTTASQDEDFFETEAQAYSDAINNALLHR